MYERLKQRLDAAGYKGEGLDAQLLTSKGEWNIILAKLRKANKSDAPMEEKIEQAFEKFLDKTYKPKPTNKTKKKTNKTNSDQNDQEVR